MKKTFLTTVSAIGLFFALISCQCNKDDENLNPGKKAVAKDRYICPMNCENGKNYESRDNAPHVRNGPDERVVLKLNKQPLQKNTK